MDNQYLLTIHPPERATDAQGSGAYGAPRGARTHNGIDLACYPGSAICAIRPGSVTKIGYPYQPNDPDKSHFRYVQITDPAGYRLRYFYVTPCVNINDVIHVGQIIGYTQRLSDVYPGITDHVHFEVMRNPGEYLDPRNFLTGMAR